MSTRGLRGTLLALALALAAAFGISRVQPELARSVHRVSQRDDVFLLPPPPELRAMTLGYRAAAADFLWAQLIYEYGLHWQEKRAFPDVTRYIDGILALEPDFSTIFRFVDTILVYTPMGGTDADARTARRYLEQGTKVRPYDPDVWLHYGQFIAFLAPSFLKDEAEIDRWRTEGALAIAHAVELGADADRSLAATTILRKAGETDAAVRHLGRAYAMTDDPAARQQILYKLQSLHANQDAELAMTSVEREWRSRWMFMSRGATLLIGPPRRAAACAGLASYDLKHCPRDWTQFVQSAR